MTIPDPGRRLLTARILAVALAAGPVLMWIISWFVLRASGGGLASDAPLTPGAAMSAWGIAAVLGFGVALLLRSRAQEAAREALGASGVEEAAPAQDRVQVLLVLAWALLEAPAVLAGAFYLMLGDTDLIVAAAPVLAFGVLLTFPRPEWFPTPRG